MARYIKAVCRLCRREQEKLFLKGTKCNTEKCPLAKRAYAPGQHGQGRRTKLSNYGLQLREKQKVKRMYGLMERQFRKYFAIASKSKGVTGKILLQLLERRLDNAIFRLGWAVSRAQARQMVGHGFIQVNSHRVNISSFLVKAKDLIQAVPKDKAKEMIRLNLEVTKDRTPAGWMDSNPKEFQASVVRLPEKEDIQSTIEEQLIVELYSK